MGSGVSTLPERLTEEEANRFAGSRFSKEVFDRLKDEDGLITREQFLTAAQSNIEKDMHEVFLKFCPSGEMDSKTFAKFCRDSKLLDSKHFTNGDADLVFSKAKARRGSAKGINYDVFKSTAVSGIADKKGVDPAVIMDQIVHCEGPVLNATQAEVVRLHDDTTTYTGAHAQGGPTFEQGGKNLDNLLDRSEADVRGVKVGDKGEEAPVERRSSFNSIGGPQRKGSGAGITPQAQRRLSGSAVEGAAASVERRNSRRGSGSVPLPVVPDDATLHSAYDAYCPTGEMDSRTFVKMLKDTGVINKHFDTNAADLVFNKAKATFGTPKLVFDTFRTVALPNAILKAEISVEEAISLLTSTSGPIYHATKTEAVRLHDDQSTYTGAHAQGGPTFDHGGKGLDDLLDRSEADVRGVKLGSGAAGAHIGMQMEHAAAVAVENVESLAVE